MFITISEPILIHYYLVIAILYLDILGFYPMFRVSSEYHITLVISLSAPVSQIFFIFNDLDSFEEYRSGSL